MSEKISQYIFDLKRQEIVGIVSNESLDYPTTNTISLFDSKDTKKEPPVVPETLYLDY